MIQGLRDNLKGTVAIIVVGLMVIPFALFGVDSLFLQDNTAGKVAEVNGEGISEVSLARQIQQRKQLLLSRFGDQVPPSMMDDENLRGPILDQLVSRELLKQAAESGRLTISDADLDKIIIEGGQFITPDGKFDAQRYTDVLRSQGFTPTTYKNELREDVQIKQLVNGLMLSVSATEADVESLTKLTLQTRAIDYLVLPYDQVATEIELSESEVDAFYVANQSDYIDPEAVTVEYIEINLADIASGIDISDETVEAQYEAELADFEAQTSTGVSHILIEHNDGFEVRVEEVAQKLAAGEDFASLAATYSDDLGTNEAGGDLGLTDGNTFPEAFEAAVALLKVDTVSDAIETDAGTHFIKVTSRETSAPASLEERREGIRQLLASAEAEERFVELIEGVPDAAYNSDSLASIADEFGVTLQTSGKVSRNGSAGIFSDNRIIGVLFSDDFYRDGNTSDLIELGDNHAVVMKMKDYFPERQLELEEVKESVERGLRDQKVDERLNAQAEEIVQQLGTQVVTLKAYAESNELEVKSEDALQRTTRSLPSGLNEFVFSMSRPNGEEPLVGATPLNNGDWAVVSLRNVTEGSADLEGEAMANTRRRLSQQYADSELAGYLQAKKDLADIEVYNK